MAVVVSIKPYQNYDDVTWLSRTKLPFSCGGFSLFIAHALIAMFRITKHIMKAVKPIPTVKVNMASSS